MKKRLLIIVIILLLCFLVFKIISRDEKIEITTDDGKKYFVSYDSERVWLESHDSYYVNLYDEHYKSLREFSIYDGIPIKTEIKYDGTIDNNSFYRMYVFTESGKCEERVWYEFEGNFMGGGDVCEYMKLWGDSGWRNELFDDMKGYVLKKINEGEYGWLYSYGETFIEEGHTEFIELIENILKERTYSLGDGSSERSMFLNDEEFYSKCEELLAKYK